MAINQLEKTFTLNEDRLESLKQIIPDAFADGKINWNTLKECLGEYLEDDSTENFGLFWTGKRDARRLAAQPSKGTLIPIIGQGIDEDTTENIFIEGDNLEVLKILRKSYKGKIKMIYIDPPYNTGNDLIYKDDYSEPLESYLRKTKQKDEEGNLLTTNKKGDGRFHSNWLNMIYPRLRIAKDLLSDEGVIFASIDGNEVHNLRHIMNEIFGEENYISTVSVVSNWKGRSDDKYIATAHEYLVVFQKGNFVSLGLPLPPEYLSEYTERDENNNPYRLLGLRKRGAGAKREDRPNMYYPFFANKSDGKLSLLKSDEFSIEIYPKLSDGSDGRWRWGKETAEERITELKARIVSGTDRFDVFQIDYAEIDGEARRIKPKSVWNDKNISNEAGTLEYKSLMGNINFSNPKSVELIKTCLIQSIDKDDLVLDFFSGSGTTAQATLELNRNGKNCKFICVQIGESIQENTEAYKAGFRQISDITAERIRRASNRIKTELDSQLPMDEKPDLGFRFYRLEQSNFRKWTEYEGKNVKELGDLFRQFESPLVEDWKIENVLAEIVLIEGFPLSSNQIIDEKFERNKVYCISHEFNEHQLFVCLDNEIYEDTVEVVADLPKQDIFICLDSALTDEAKIKLADVCQIKTF